jgi:pimeloyl-ACP methyl ester carboxylesterase
MAKDVIAFIHALGYDKVDLLGFSLGGFVSQEILLAEPQLVRKVILAGTGPRGGKGISDVVGLTYKDLLKGYLTFRDPKFYLFFAQSKNGKDAARQFLSRLKERKENRDTKTKIKAFSTQLKAIDSWGHQQPADLSVFKQPIFIVNGDADRMVPTPNSYDMAKRFPNTEVVIYKDAGHGGIFQYHEFFVKSALEFFNK